VTGVQSFSLPICIGYEEGKVIVTPNGFIEDSKEA
jgi:hypothetical protein